ncbi:MAG TPA: BTAD domain-containing putative transcriptional regulator [Actinophytocola sp.]|uniref:AfsR/SARP family transcriptional regulator n=1 Tax=Actinophytocola sp. TaxID=1872138 RepID=UPI002E07E54D|nr:BTAD domain-containing putative transcriptional regulator [Actinophytocola sp.]
MPAVPDFRLLGTLEVTSAGEQRPLRTGKLRVVLATLLLRANQTVPVDELIDRLWGDTPPAAARNTAQTYVMRLRQVLGDDPRNPKLIHTLPGGYQITVTRDQLDLSRFRYLVQHAEGLEPDAATEALHEALALWRGPALADIPSESLRGDELPRLTEERLRALERRIDLDLEVGRHGDLVVELSTLTKEHPLRERFWGQLMLALFRSGRQAEALHTYREVRELLVDQLGVEPGAGLQRLHEGILRDDAQLRTGTPAPASTTPRQLPADVASFTGREQELAQLADLAAASGSVVISAIHGTAGVGKTALAVHFGHTVAGRFPDGQLYLDLRGYAPTPAMTPGEALERLLRSLGLPPERIPREEQEQAATYRSLIAGKRVLVVLDNARTAEQVEPLLPGYPGCLVVITSRGTLSTVDCATRLQLDVLTEEEALTLLARTAGQDRVEADPGMAATLVDLCARLPLAVRIAGARLAARPGWTIGTLVQRLADAQHRLDELQVADRAVRASFAVSYHALRDGDDPVDRTAARVFRVLGMLDWVDMSVPVAAALAELPEPDVHAALERLVDDHLLDSTTPGRYHTHDLLRLYARDRAEHAEPDRQAALLRALDCYLTSAELAALLLNPDTPRIPEDPTRATRSRFALCSPADAAAWIDAEHANLLAVAHQAAASASPAAAALTVRLTASLNWALNLRGHWRDLIDARRLAARMACQLGDRPAEALALQDLGWAYWRVGRADDAVTITRRALEAWRELGDGVREQSCLSNLGAVYRAQNRLAEAIRCYQDGVKICRTIDSRRGASRNLDGLGLVYQRQGRFAEAIICHEQGLAIDRELGDRFAEAISLGNLGWAHHRAGRHAQGLAYHQQSLTIAREVKDACQEAETLWGLGQGHHALGHPEPARTYWQQSIEILRGLGELTDDEAQTLLRQPVPDTPGIIQRNT